MTMRLLLAFVLMCGLAVGGESPEQQKQDVMCAAALMENGYWQTANALIDHLEYQGSPQATMIREMFEQYAPAHEKENIRFLKESQEKTRRFRAQASMPSDPVRSNFFSQARNQAEQDDIRQQNYAIANAREMGTRLLNEFAEKEAEAAEKAARKEAEDKAEREQQERERRIKREAREAREKARQKRLAEYETDSGRIAGEKIALWEELKEDFSQYKGLIEVNADPMSMTSENEYNFAIAYKYEPTGDDIDTFNMMVLMYVHNKLDEADMLEGRPHIRCRSFFIPPGQSNIVLQYGKAHWQYDQGYKVYAFNRYWWDWADGE